MKWVALLIIKEAKPLWKKFAFSSLLSNDGEPTIVFDTYSKRTVGVGLYSA